MSQAHLDIAAALAQGGGPRGSRGQGRKVVILQPRKGKMGEVGGEKSPRNTGVWSWRIRGVLPEITLLLVCPNFHFFLLVSLAALALDSSLPHLVLMQSLRLMLARTHFLGLASYFPRLRFYRHRCDPAFSAEYYNFRARRLHTSRSRQYIPSTPGRKTIGSYFFRNCNLGLTCRRKKVL